MIVPFAKYEPVIRIDDGPRPHLNKALVLHTAVSGAVDLYSFWQGGAAGPGVGAHFYINQSGDLYQYLDTDCRTGHAYAANDFAVGVETWDGGHPESTPWNAYQVATILQLCRALGVPGKALLETPSDGVGYHCQYPGWNLSGHTCPDAPRILQVKTVIIPALAGPPAPPPSPGGFMADISQDDANRVAWAAQQQQGYRAHLFAEQIKAGDKTIPAAWGAKPVYDPKDPTYFNRAAGWYERESEHPLGA